LSTREGIRAVHLEIADSQVRTGGAVNRVDCLLAKVGLAHKLDLMGMAMDRLSPPTRAFPNVQLSQIVDAETRFALADLNADSYGVPKEWARQALPLRGECRNVQICKRLEESDPAVILNKFDRKPHRS
jgi:hypothetical protein